MVTTYWNAWIFMEVISAQEAMENFVFPDEIKTKLIKISKLKNIFDIP